MENWWKWIRTNSSNAVMLLIISEGFGYFDPFRRDLNCYNGCNEKWWTGGTFSVMVTSTDIIISEFLLIFFENFRLQWNVSQYAIKHYNWCIIDIANEL